MIVTRKSRLIPLLLVTATLLPTAARADTGTVLMWATMFHLFVGNAFIGIFEGLLIAVLFRLAKWPTIGVFIAGNYFSAFAGGTMLYALWEPFERLFLGEALLYRIPLMLGSLWVFSWLLTVVLEWPFCYWALKWPRVHSSGDPMPTRKRLKTAWKVSLIAQTASYALLTPYYFYASNLSLYNEAHLQRNLSFVHQPAAMVYYMNSQDGSIWKVGTDGTGRTKVLTPPHSSEGFLMLKPDQRPGQCSLYLIDFDDSSHSSEDKPRSETKLVSNIPGRCAIAQEEPDYPERVLDLRGDAEHDWNVLSGQFAWGVLRITYQKQRVYRLGMETPFFHWACGNVTILPGDQVVFMEGYSLEDVEVLMLDMKSRRLGLLAVGRSPVVLLPPGT